MSNDIDADFGHWFAGFSDGEGCFDIKPIRSSYGATSYMCRFTIGLRADDRPILDEIQRRTGLGTVRISRRRQDDGAGDQARWTVSRKRECAQLIHIFDAYPLRAKKADDYTLWRQAVQDWLTKTNRGSRALDWSHIAALRACLIEGRKWHGTTEPLAVSDQLVLAA